MFFNPSIRQSVKIIAAPKAMFSYLFLISAPAFSQSIYNKFPEVATTVKFQYNRAANGIPVLQKFETYPWGTQRVTFNPRVRTSDVDAGNFAHSVLITNNPLQLSGQQISFNLISNGFFFTGGHLAMIGKADGGATFNAGRGFTIGRLYRKDAGIGGSNSVPCPNASGQVPPTGQAWVQAEAWKIAGVPYTTTSWVGGGSNFCGNAYLQDGITYKVIIQNNNNAASISITGPGVNIGYYFTDSDSGQSGPNINSNTGYTLSAVLGNYTPQGVISPTNVANNWSLQMSNISVAWF
jgi:hypothetical protein